MLRLFFTAILLTITISPIFSQEFENDAKIKEYLGNERFENSLQNNPGFIKFLDIKVEKGYVIEVFNPNKSDDFIEISTITYNGEEKGGQISVEEFLNRSHLESFNILFYQFPMPENGGNGYFLLEGTGKVISIYSNKHLNNQL